MTKDEYTLKMLSIMSKDIIRTLNKPGKEKSYKATCESILWQLEKLKVDLHGWELGILPEVLSEK